MFYYICLLSKPIYADTQTPPRKHISRGEKSYSDIDRTQASSQYLILCAEALYHNVAVLDTFKGYACKVVLLDAM